VRERGIPSHWLEEPEMFDMVVAMVWVRQWRRWRNFPPAYANPRTEGDVGGACGAQVNLVT
jgi:hypothetical protein